MNISSRKIILLCVSCLGLLFLSSCVSSSPKSKRLAETTSIGAGLGVALAYLIKADPIAGVVLGGILGYGEGTRINKEVDDSARRLDGVNARIYRLEKSNHNLRRGIEEKKELTIKLDSIINNLNTENIAHNQQCRDRYYRYKRAQYSTISLIEDLENKKQLLRNKISSIEERDYSYEDKQEIYKLQELNNSLQEYIYIKYIILKEE